MQKLSVILISDFNLSNFQGYLNNCQTLPLINAASIPFGQVMQSLLSKNTQIWPHRYDIALIWTQPEAIINSYSQLLYYGEFDESLLIKEVDSFVSSIERLSDRVKSVFVPLWTKPVYLRGSGILSHKSRYGINYALLKLNERLTYKLSNSNNLHILDSQSWMQMAGKNAFNPKLWYMGKVPFSNEVFIQAVEDVKSAARAIYGVSKKLVIVDLDDTMWGGNVGDVGWQNLILGQHSSSGEAYIDFQKGLKSLIYRGIILGIVSKNDESVALEAIEAHPEMVIKKSDISAFRINWNDKASNIVELVNELNVGLESVVFIDDNPFERALVRETLPEVLVPEWPNNSMLYKSALLTMDCFDIISITQEDLERTKMYDIEETRNILKQGKVSVEDWIISLSMCITVDIVTDFNIKRVSQLINKTNQMNLATRRMTESDLSILCQQSNLSFYCINVEDKFGEYGLTGFIGFMISDGALVITDFILSCRVMGRKVEETMLYFAINQAKILGASVIRAEYLPTSKNRPCLDFLRRSGFQESTYVFSFNPQHNYSLPQGVTLKSN